LRKPRIEGEANGEWIIVDCGQAVVHIMQPNFRTYYNLEELWGEKPVRLKFGAAKPAMAESEAADRGRRAARARLGADSLGRLRQAFPARVAG
jgi:ribosome-associated protein